tara:strand:- start:1125 stop:1418 length:294 start_codon:yes stop_codon:yes gene_type:complete
MARVKFGENFFGSDGVYYEKGQIHEIPNSMLEKGKLPSDAIIIEGVKEEAPAPDPETMSNAIHRGRGKYDVFKAGKLVGDNLTKKAANEMVAELNGE